VGLDQHRAGQAQQGGGVGEDADDVGAALDLLVLVTGRSNDRRWVPASSISTGSWSVLCTTSRNPLI
jgi:hypothetical protein